MNTKELTEMKRDEYNCEGCVILPPVDIYEAENEYIIKAEMPGVRKEDIDITFQENRLDINGKINDDGSNIDNLKNAEYRMYNFHRSFKAGNDIDINSVSANIENGVLSLLLPKKEGVKPMKIDIKTN